MLLGHFSEKRAFRSDLKTGLSALKNKINQGKRGYSFMNLTSSHLAFLITFFSLGIVVLTLFNIHLGAQIEEEYAIELSLADEDLEAMLQEMEEKEKAESDPIKTHMALNETAKPRYGAPEPLKTLEEIMAERAQAEGTEPAESTNAEEFSNSLEQLARLREEKKELLGQKEAEKKEYTSFLSEKRTTISYSLINRNHLELPPPIYTCIEGGKVVINIEVDNRGFVTEATYNDKSSSTSNGCLVEKGIEYAQMARFNPSDKTSQKGTITYLFQRK
jgi:hypothetical protein